MSHFAKTLSRLLEAKRISQNDLAYRIGLSRPAIGNLLAGGKPSWETVQLLALALEVDACTFCDPALRTRPKAEPKRRGRPPKTEPEPKKKTRKRSA